MKTAWMASLALAMGAAAQTKVEMAPPDVIVLVENDTMALRRYVVEQAEQKAAAMFREIGLRVAWEKGKAKGQVAIVVLHLEITDPPYPDVKEDMAYAYAYPYAGAARPITIRADRLNERCQLAPGLAPALLAHVMVHEITHVLQGTDYHSATGVMKAQFVSSDYRDMINKPLPFTGYDVTWIRRGLERLRERAHAEAGSR